MALALATGCGGEDQPAEEQGQVAPVDCPPGDLACLPPTIDYVYPCPSFEVRFEEGSPWPLGRYYIRASQEGGESHVCSVEFGPVTGAVVENCNGLGEPLVVAYKYTAQWRGLTTLTLLGPEEPFNIEVLVSENEDPLLDLHHEADNCDEGTSVAVSEEWF